MSHPSAPHPLIPVRYGSRDGSGTAGAGRSCPICATSLPSARAHFCSAACKQRAYRLRRVDFSAADATGLARTLKRLGDLAAHTIYECPLCDARFLGTRRCPDCNRFCRALGLGGACPHCDEPLLIAELLGKEVLL